MTDHLAVASAGEITEQQGAAVAHGVRREAFRDRMRVAFGERFGVEILTEWSVIHMRLVTRRVDESDFTAEHRTWLEGYEAGYDPDDEGRA